MIANIAIEEVRLFSTKSKTNFMICLELIKPEEYLMRNTLSLRDNFEKFIQSKCEKMLDYEMKGKDFKYNLDARNSFSKHLNQNPKNTIKNPVIERNTLAPQPSHIIEKPDQDMVS